MPRRRYAGCIADRDIQKGMFVEYTGKHVGWIRFQGNQGHYALEDTKRCVVPANGFHDCFEDSTRTLAGIAQHDAKAGHEVLVLVEGWGDALAFHPCWSQV